MILAAASSTSSFFVQVTTAIANLFGKMDGLAHPKELMKVLQDLPVAMAGVLLAVGLVCLLAGCKVYRSVVILIAALTGLVVGFQLGAVVDAELIVAVCLGVLLAVVAWPLMKYAVAIAGGLAGAFMGANAWTAAMAVVYRHEAHPPTVDAHWVGALVGLMMLGLLSFILFEISVLLFTSISGAVLALMGTLALLLQIPAFHDTIEQGIHNAAILPMMVVVPTVIGIVFQHHHGGLKATKKPPVAKNPKAPAGAMPKPA